jgi:hypothetical protein
VTIYIGGTEITDIKIGSTDINTVWIGATKIWERITWTFGIPVTSVNDSGALSGGLTITNAGVLNFNGATDSYYATPSNTAIGQYYEAMLTKSSGTSPISGSLSTWRSLTSGASWTWETYTNEIDFSGTVTIREKANTSNSDSFTYSINVQCFTADTKILMADGSQKRIAEVQEGDVVMGEGGSFNTVEKAASYDKIDSIYKINDGDYFVTGGHPFKTTDGWKAMRPTATSDSHRDLNVTELHVGDQIITREGTETVFAITFMEMPVTVYNLAVDGNDTFFANGYLVHNK